MSRRWHRVCPAAAAHETSRLVAGGPIGGALVPQRLSTGLRPSRPQRARNSTTHTAVFHGYGNCACRDFAEFSTPPEGKRAPATATIRRWNSGWRQLRITRGQPGALGRTIFAPEPTNCLLLQTRNNAEPMSCEGPPGCCWSRRTTWKRTLVEHRRSASASCRPDRHPGSPLRSGAGSPLTRSRSPQPT
jgi:hypothetical protein